MSVCAGFAKTDITPRVGVELAGFGPFCCRKSIAVRDKLWARAMAVRKDDDHFIIVSCDLIGLGVAQTRKIRKIVCDNLEVDEKSIMVHCTHTHSGPSIKSYSGWGEYDMPYLETLPYHIAKACIEAWKNLTCATIEHAEVPCEGIGLNREYDIDAPPLAEILDENWRPAKPELTDTTCHVIKVKDSNDKMIGFASYFGCHPVVCCAETRYIHGDYVGVATNMLERENQCVGLFIQGAQGDVNSCCVHKSENDSLLALDVIAARYARAVRNGLNKAKVIVIDKVAYCNDEISFTRQNYDIEKIEKLLADYESKVHNFDATDADRSLRMNCVYIAALRKFLKKKEHNQNLSEPTEIQAVRFGPVTITASGFETFQNLKNRVVKARPAPITLVAGLTNDAMGYAVDKTKAGQGGYAADIVPFITGQIPYAKIYEELPEALIAAAIRLNG